MALSLSCGFLLRWDASRIMEAAGNTNIGVANLVELGAGIGICSTAACCNWILYAVVSKSFRKAYVQMYRKLRDM